MYAVSSVLLLLVYSSATVWGTLLSNSHSSQSLVQETRKTNAVSGANNLVYFVDTGLVIEKLRYSLFQRVKRQILGDYKPEIKELTVKSTVVSRFGTVVMDSVIENTSPDDKEATFQVMLPEEAFMSNFTMMIDGQLYQTEVVSKEEAEKRYEEAQQQNKTAGMVSNEDVQTEKKIRGMDKFQISVNVAGKSRIEFSLTYLELLIRRFGFYEQRISIRPNQIIEKLHMSVQVYEEQGILESEVVEPYGTNSLQLLDTQIYDNTEDNMLEVSFTPSIERQKEMSTAGVVGLNGDLVVRYDVDHSNAAGFTQVENGFFVHFFSPDAYTVVLPKNVIFVIDISGSMGGSKIEKTREALLIILDQLNTNDMFMLLLFDDDQEYWPESETRLVAANTANVKSAKEYVMKHVKADGGTNINDALVLAARYFVSEQFGENMIVFLTDGDPSAGETNTAKIQDNVMTATNGKTSIFSLGFGFHMNFALLQAISFRNHGFALRIYDDISADIQLKTFFKEIGGPVLYDVQMNYPKDLVLSVTQVAFPQFFTGSELVVAGQLKENRKEWNFMVTCTTGEDIQIPGYVTDDIIQVPPAARDIYEPTFIERLYTYLKIKDLIRLELMTDVEDEKKQLQEMALRMALEYHLVTPLTSFLIIQDDPQEPRMWEDMATGQKVGMPGMVSSGIGRLTGVGCSSMLFMYVSMTLYSVY